MFRHHFIGARLSNGLDPEAIKAKQYSMQVVIIVRALDNYALNNKVRET